MTHETLSVSSLSKPERVRAVLREAKGTFISIYFVKVDGSIRQLTTNKRDIKGILGEAASERAQQAVATRKANNPDIINVRDITLAKQALREGKPDTTAWRSFDANRVIKIVAGGKTHHFN